MDNSIRPVYQSLLTTVFPRWKAGRQWAVRVGQRAEYLCGDGFCEADQKVIWVGEHVAADNQRLPMVLAHEIVHGIVGPGHGKKFCRRLGKAAEMAGKTGDHQLAHDLQSEQKLYENAPVVRAEDVYGLMRDWAIEAPSFEAAERGLAREFGLTIEELRGKYRKLRAQWGNARKRHGID